MNDEQMMVAFGQPDVGLDGKWSAQTRLLMKQMGAEELELNKWWTLTPQNWKCPSCDQRKPKLVKLNSKKVLIAKLASHHDHANEWVKDKLPIVWMHDGKREPNSHALRTHLKKLAKGFLTRFPPTIICEGCNNLEVKLKKKFNIPSVLTLTPSEIGKLKNYAGSNDAPSLDTLILQLVNWVNASENLIELAKKSFQLGVHPVTNEFHKFSDHIERTAISTIKSKFEKLQVSEIDPVSEFLKLSEAKTNADNSKQVNWSIPSILEFNEYKHPHPMRQSIIDKTPDEWRCPICFRSKYECFSSSANKKKSFNLNLMERKISDEFGQTEVAATICGHCNEFSNEFVKFCNSEGNEQLSVLTPSGAIDAVAVRNGIESAPHQRHKFNFKATLAFLMGPFDSHSELDVEVEY